jgi:hypothetical protein
MALAFASLFRWRKEVEQAVSDLASLFSQWVRTGDTYLVLLVLAIIALALVYLVPWIARRIVAPGLGCTFEQLSPEQKGYLTAQFLRGLRRIEVSPMMSRQRWFEALVRLGYVERREIPLQTTPAWSDDVLVTMPYEVTAAAWRELRRKLSRDGNADDRDLGAGRAEP